jgi:hypothetical protein
VLPGLVRAVAPADDYRLLQRGLCLLAELGTVDIVAPGARRDPERDTGRLLAAEVEAGEVHHQLRLA